MTRSQRRPAPALFVAVIALVLAMSGAAVALKGQNTVDKNDIVQGAVNTSDIKDANVGVADLAPDSVDASKVRDESLSETEFRDYQKLGVPLVKVTATEGATLAAAQAAAPQTTLLTRGPLTLYAKCYRDTAGNRTDGTIYAKTSQDGVVMEGVDDHPALDNTLLNTATAETDSEFASEFTNTTGGQPSGYIFEDEGFLLAPDGTALHVLSYIGLKQGSFPNGNGAFGDGNVCLFGGPLFG